MSFPRTRAVLLTLSLVTASGCLVAASINDSRLNPDFGGFYANHAECWYWYQEKKEDPVEETQPEQSQPKETPPPTSTGVTTPAPSSPAEPPPAALSAAWMRKMLPRYLDAMWTNPTPENVRAFLLLQRYALDQSQKVAQMGQQVVGDVLLDEAMRRPTSTAASHAIDDEQAANVRRVLTKLSSRAAILYFYKGTCPYCRQQLPILKWLRHDYGFSVVAVSVDGGPPSEPVDFPVRPDQGQAAQLHVQTVPAVFLTDATGKTDTFAQGLMSLPELVGRFVVSGVRNGWLTPEDLQATQSLPAAGRGIPNLAQTHDDSSIADLSQVARNLLQDPQGFVAPRNIIAFFSRHHPQYLTRRNTLDVLSARPLPGFGSLTEDTGSFSALPFVGVNHAR